MANIEYIVTSAVYRDFEFVILTERKALPYSLNRLIKRQPKWEEKHNEIKKINRANGLEN